MRPCPCYKYSKILDSFKKNQLKWKPHLELPTVPNYSNYVSSDLLVSSLGILSVLFPFTKMKTNIVPCVLFAQFVNLTSGSVVSIFLFEFINDITLHYYLFVHVLTSLEIHCCIYW